MSTEQSNIFWRKFFYFAAFFNWYVSISVLFSPLWLLDMVVMKPPFEHTLYEQTVYGLIGVFGFAYFFVARDLNQRRLVQVGLLSKVVWVTLVIGNWYMGNISWHLLPAAAIDSMFAMCFVSFLRRN